MEKKEKKCKNCEFYSRDDLGNHVCVNNERDYCADWVEPEHCCEEWSEKDNV